MPTPTRVAVILLVLLGVLLLLNSAVTWFGQEAIVDRLAEESGADRDTAAQQLLLFLIAYGVMGLSAVLAAAFLPRRRPWARQVGILVMSLLAAITLVLVLSSGGVSPYWLLTLVTSSAAVTSLLSRQTRDWVRGDAPPA